MLDQHPPEYEFNNINVVETATNERKRVAAIVIPDILVAKTTTNERKRVSFVIPDATDEQRASNCFNQIIEIVSIFSPITKILFNNFMVSPAQNQQVHTKQRQLRSQDIRNEKKEFIRRSLTTIIYSGIFVLLIGIALPITILVMNSSYSDEIKCHPNISTEISSLERNIGVKTWLYVIGLADLISTEIIIFSVIIAFVSITNDDTCLLKFTSFMLFTHLLLQMFRFSWLIIGCVLFWRDCIHLEPSPINKLMIATLITGFIGFAPLPLPLNRKVV
jgi:hypothetical protein